MYEVDRHLPTIAQSFIAETSLPLLTVEEQ